LERGVLFGVIVHAAEIGTCPDASFGVFAKCIDGIIGKGIGVEEFFPEIGQAACIQIKYEDAGFRAQPELAGGILQYIPYVDGRLVGVVSQDVLVVAGGGVE